MTKKGNILNYENRLFKEFYPIRTEDEKDRLLKEHYGKLKKTAKREADLTKASTRCILKKMNEEHINAFAYLSSSNCHEDSEYMREALSLIKKVETQDIIDKLDTYLKPMTRIMELFTDETGKVRLSIDDANYLLLIHNEKKQAQYQIITYTAALLFACAAVFIAVYLK